MRKYFFLSCIFLPLCASPLFAAPNVNQATSEAELFSQDAQKKLLRIPSKPQIPEAEEAPAPAGEEKFLIKNIVLEGCESFPPEDFDFILNKYENKELSITQLENIAKEVEREYLRKGVVAAVILPPQESAEQTVRMRVIEAKMGALIIQPHKYFNNERLFYYWDIPGGEVVEYNAISRSVQMMNKNPDRDVRAALRAGKQPGTTDVILTPKTRFPLHFTASFDNQGVTSTGKSRIGIGARYNNFLGFDDSIIYGYNYGHAFDGQYVYHNLPLGYNGTTLLYGYSLGKSIPKGEYAPSCIISTSENSIVSLHQDLYSQDDYLGEVYSNFEAKDKTTEAIGGLLNKDRLRIVRLGTNLIFRDVGGTLSFNPELSRGLGAFGASERHNPYASRGAPSEFTKFRFNLSYSRPTPLNTQTNFKFAGQVANTKLTPQEEMVLGGIDVNRGYPSNDYSADCGATTNVEMLIPGFFIPANWRLPYARQALRDQTTMVAFCDYGYGMLRKNAPSERHYVNELSIGAGFRHNFYDQALLRLEWGFIVGNNRSLTESGKSQFNFSVDFQDKLPEEIERILKERREEYIRQAAFSIVQAEYEKPDSLLRKKLLSFLSNAQNMEKENNPEEARSFYELILQTSESVYQQAEEYVRLCLAQQQELKTENRAAEQFYRAGNPIKAKEIWDKVAAQAPKELVLQF